MYLRPGEVLLADVTHDRWPGWARPQLLAAVELAGAPATCSGRALATELYDRWFSGAVVGESVPTRPLAGAYRDAHAASTITRHGGVDVLERYDRIGTDGWWRTWNTLWQPRHDDARVLLSPRAQSMPELVALLTSRLGEIPYVLACPTVALHLSRSGSVVLHLSRLSALTPELVADLRALLRPDTPPLCLPLGPGIAVAQYPDNGMTFGEHRCHLLALALADARTIAPADSLVLDVIAEVFAAHGVDPSTPYRN
jgi:hypothetical protein